MNRDALAARLRALFADELAEGVLALNRDFLALEHAPRNAARLQAVFRVAHTLKGAAQAAGVPAVGRVCHELEALLARARDGAVVLGPEDLAELFQVADAFASAAQRLKEGAEPDARALEALLFGLVERGERVRVSGAAAEPPDEMSQTPPAEPPSASPPVPEARTGNSPDLLRVEAVRLDALLSTASRLLVAQGRLETQVQAAREVEAKTARWASQLRHMTAPRGSIVGNGHRDAPGTARAMRDMSERVRTLTRQAERLATDLRRDANALSETAHEIADRVRRLRQRPFGESTEPLARATRDLATALGKNVELVVEGVAVEADRAVVDGLRDALLQLVRNAVDHGIESPAARAAAGKPARALVRIAAVQQGDHLVVTVRDDGGGLDVPAIRAAMARSGSSPEIEDREVVRRLLKGGVTSRASAGAISGRGVGLDIVRDAVSRIRGSLSVDWERGRGTTFRIDCPPSQALTRVVLVGIGPHLFALPTANVTRVLRFGPGEIAQVEGKKVLPSEGGVPVVALAKVLDLREWVGEPETAFLTVVLAAGDQRLAVVVDALHSEEQVLVRPVTEDRTAIPLVAGAVLLGTGRVAPVLDVEALCAAAQRDGPRFAPSVAPGTENPGRPQRRILVVDDSITARSLEQSILEAAGYLVTTAVDGADAWRILQEVGADLVVADVEMPRMDGISLCVTIRASARFRELPVVLVTALADPVHRTRGLDAGADAYIGKSGFDQQELLETIERLVGDE